MTVQIENYTKNIMHKTVLLSFPTVGSQEEPKKLKEIEKISERNKKK